MTPFIQEYQSLHKRNSFGFSAVARYFSVVKTREHINQLLDFVDHNALPLLVLGEGSNIVLAADAPGAVLKLAIRGIERVNETAEHVLLRVGAGENWHSFVRWCLQHGYYGCENLSLIPGSVGAAPVQNIGAYGVELKDFFVQLEAVDRRTGQQVTLDCQSCQFGYRDSIFKAGARDRFIITHVLFKLSKNSAVNTRYGAIDAELKIMRVEPSPQSVSEAICRMRRRKLPDPLQIGNAGSFFKNPVITESHFHELQLQAPGIIGYPDKKGAIKLAAGWLIERCGWKGYREGDIGVHAHQALVLVNYGAGTAGALLDLSLRIRCSVKQAFGVELEMEPSVYPAP